jgi:hypothetical protein
MAGTENRVFSARREQCRFRQFSHAQTLKGNMISDTASWSVIMYVCTLEDHSKHLVGQSVGEQTSYTQLGCTKMTKFRHCCSTLENAFHIVLSLPHFLLPLFLSFFFCWVIGVVALALVLVVAPALVAKRALAWHYDVYCDKSTSGWVRGHCHTTSTQENDIDSIVQGWDTCLAAISRHN